MNRKRWGAIAISTMMFFASNQLANSAENLPGGKCSSAGSLAPSNGSELKCVKKNSKLIWQTLGSVDQLSQKSYSISTKVDSHSSVYPVGTTSYKFGNIRTYTFHALAGYQISHVIVDNASKGAIKDFTFTWISSNHTISVLTAPLVAPGPKLTPTPTRSPTPVPTQSSTPVPTQSSTPAPPPVATYSISASADGGSTISPSGPSTFTAGSTASYSFSANSGYHISNVIIDGVGTSNSSPFVFTNIQGNHSISITTSSNPPPTPADTLHAGNQLNAGQAIVSGDGRFTAIMQTDGNFVVYGPAGAMWASNTSTGGSFIAMQTDGNLVIYNPSGKAKWSSATAPSNGDYLVMQSDGNLVLYSGSGNALWASKTVFSEGSSGGDTFGYPYQSAASCGSGIWCINGKYLSPIGFAYRNCTDFVAFKLGITWGSMNFPGGDGNAEGWINSPRFTHSTTATPGSVAYWPGTSSNGGFGHVAYVVSVNSNGSANVEQYNADFKGNPSAGTVNAPYYLVLH